VHRRELVGWPTRATWGPEAVAVTHLSADEPEPQTPSTDPTGVAGWRPPRDPTGRYERESTCCHPPDRTAPPCSFTFRREGNVALCGRAASSRKKAADSERHLAVGAATA
jgi:hypothetical protein